MESSCLGDRERSVSAWSSLAELLGEGIVKSIRDSSDSENGMNMNVGDVLYLVDNLNTISSDTQTTK